jgi:hypothetical protein
MLAGAEAPFEVSAALCRITFIDRVRGFPTAYTMVTVPAWRPSSSGPRIGFAATPDGSSATVWAPAATSAVAYSPLAMSRNTTAPSTRTSAGATVAVWASRTRALPGAIGERGVR